MDGGVNLSEAAVESDWIGEQVCDSGVEVVACL
jgi:hypothetical protein